MDKLINQYNKRWHSPTNVYMHLQELVKIYGFNLINKSPQYKRVREARIGAIMAFVVSRIRNLPTFLRLPLNDPPDLYLMQPNSGTMDIITVEITSYRESEEPLLEQLKRTKFNQKYLYELTLLVELLTRTVIDYESMLKYKLKHNIDMPIWLLSKIQDFPDTIGEVITIDTDINKFNINIGEEAYCYNKKFGSTAVIFSKRAFKLDDVRKESIQEECRIPPWENLED